MKKYLTLTAMVCLLGLATACGNKEKVLECSKDQKSAGMNMTQNIKATFKNKNVTYIDMSIDVKVEDTYKPYIDTMMTSVEGQLSEYKGKKGMTLDTKKKSTGFVVNLKADLAKMDKDTKEDLDMMNTTADFEESKKEFEDEGYTCK